MLAPLYWYVIYGKGPTFPTNAVWHHRTKPGATWERGSETFWSGERAGLRGGRRERHPQRTDKGPRVTFGPHLSVSGVSQSLPSLHCSTLSSSPCVSAKAQDSHSFLCDFFKEGFKKDLRQVKELAWDMKEQSVMLKKLEKVLKNGNISTFYYLLLVEFCWYLLIMLCCYFFAITFE